MTGYGGGQDERQIDAVQPCCLSLSAGSPPCFPRRCACALFRNCSVTGGLLPNCSLCQQLQHHHKSNACWMAITSRLWVAGNEVAADKDVKTRLEVEHEVEQAPAPSSIAALNGDASSGWGPGSDSAGEHLTQQSVQDAPQQWQDSSRASPKALRSPRSFQQPSGTAGPAAQRQGSLRSKSENARKGVRRLGAEPLGRASPRVSSSAEAIPPEDSHGDVSADVSEPPSLSRPEVAAPNETPRSNRSSSRSPRSARAAGQLQEKAPSTPRKTGSVQAPQSSADVR